MSISAIVVSYQTGPVLADCIKALRADPVIKEIILVDNGNPKGAVETAIAGDGAPVQLLSGHGNIGFAAACNLGVNKAGGDVLLFINPDAVLPENGAARMLNDAKGLERPWLMGAKPVNADGSEQRGGRRAEFTPWRAIVDALGLYRIGFQRLNLHVLPAPAAIIEVPTISGACFMIPKADYQALGGMDEGYFLHVEDIDFCRRHRLAGGKVYFNPHVAIMHERSSSDVSPLQVFKWKSASFARYFRIHFSDTYPAPALWFASIVLWCAHGARALLADGRRPRG